MEEFEQSIQFNYYLFIFWTSEYPSWQNALRIYKKMETPHGYIDIHINEDYAVGCL